MNLLLAVLFACLSFSSMQVTEAHGIMSVPKSRNIISRTDHYCPHCFNGGGTGNVASNSGGVWPAVETEETSKRHGLCGDPAGQDDHMVGGKSYTGEIVATYQSGSTIDIEIGVTAHHNGHFEFYLCNKGDLADPSGPITQDCLNKYPLKRTEGFPATNPVDPSYPNRYYLDPKCSLSQESFPEAGITAFKVPTMRFDLPDIECEHCVLQWYWVTANSCLAPGYREYSWPSTHSECGGDGGSVGWWAPHLSDCETKGYPEEFWNCADIKLVRDGPTNAPTEEPVTTQAPTIRSNDDEPVPTQAPTSQATEDETTEPELGGSFVDQHGKLTLDGVQLVGERGEPVHLKGMSSHGIHWFENCYTKESIQHLRDEWNINLFRIAMYIGENGYASQPHLKQRVEEMVDWCEELGIYVMIDWHVLTPGDPNAWLDSEGGSTGLAIDWWVDMATQYKDKKHVLYEIANEPNNIDWSKVKLYHDAVIHAIRAVDQETIIIAGTTTWSQDIHLAAQNPVADPYNVMYAFHFYAGTHESLLDRVIEYASQIPIFSTEWGTSQASGDGGPYLDIAERFLDTFEELSISWAQWSFADKAEVSAALNPGACSRMDWSDTSTSGTFVKNYLLRDVDSSKTKAPTALVIAPTDGPTDEPQTPQPTTTKIPSDGCSIPVTFQVVNDWTSGFQGGVTIENILGDTITSWKLSFHVPQGQTFNSGWEGVFDENAGLVVVTPESWQSIVHPGSKLTPGFTVQGAGARSFTYTLEYESGGVLYTCDDSLEVEEMVTVSSAPSSRPTGAPTLMQKLTSSPTLLQSSSCEDLTKKKKCKKSSLNCVWKNKKCKSSAVEENQDAEEEAEQEDAEEAPECVRFTKKKKCKKAKGCAWKKKACVEA